MPEPDEPDRASDGPRSEPTPGDDQTDSFDLEHPEEVHVGAARGELDTEIGPPRDHPDRADLSVRPESGDRVVLTIDVSAADHAVGHADVPLSVADARALRDVLEETIRWMSESESGDDGGRQ